MSQRSWYMNLMHFTNHKRGVATTISFLLGRKSWVYENDDWENVQFGYVEFPTLSVSLTYLLD